MIGKILGNRYEIIEQVGGGGMALVYKAKCHLLDRFVAIKVLRDEFIDDEDFIRKFKRESQAAASLSHPNILNIYDVGVEEDGDKKIHYIVMEFIKGPTLKDVIKEKGKLSVEDTIYYSLQIAEALEHAHKNHIVHRDIKPHNIMLTEDNRIKVTDFGIARAVTSSTVTTTSSVLGSVHYFSPEQARGGYTDEKSDIYSLGIVMYEMITGRLPYEAESPITVALKHVQEDIKPPRELDTTIPFNLEAVILRCVQKRQNDRYGSITELINDLKSIKTFKNAAITNTKNDDDSATRLIPAVNPENGDNKPMGKKKKTKNKKKSDGGLLPIFSAILLAFILVTGIFYGFFKLKGILEIDEVLVPSVVGMQEEAAKEKIEGLDLQFKVLDRINSEQPAGEVIFQDIDEGIHVKVGHTIGVTVSAGEDLVKVPMVVNKTITEAEILIEEAGLRMDIPEYVYDDSIPENIVIEQDPTALSELKPNSKVKLIVSKGPEVRTVIMPKVVDMPINLAKNEIVALDLVVGEITPHPSNDVPVDTVIWQEYEQGTELETGTSVDLYISSGPDTSTPPEEEEPDGDEYGSITLTLTPFSDREETEITIFRKQDGITEVVYNRKHKAIDGAVVVPIEGKIGAIVEVHFDGIFQGNQTITKE